jgi:hypothetical protein
MNVTTVQNRPAFVDCITGQATIIVAGGRSPYTIRITAAPAGYTGRTIFYVDSDLNLDSLNAGAYTVSVTDACGATAPTQGLTVTSLTSADGFGFTMYQPVTGNCNLVAFKDIGSTNPELNTYRYEGEVEMAFTVDGVTSTYRAANLTPDTIALSNGKSISDLGGATVGVSFRAKCGSILTTSRVMPVPQIRRQIEYNCNVNFNLNFDVYYGQSMMCYPLYVTLKNKLTNQYRYDTIKAYQGADAQHIMRNLDFGDYTFSVKGIDGKEFTPYTDFTVTPPGTASPYSVTVDATYSSIGKQGYAIFGIYKTSLFTAGTKIEVIGPANMNFVYNVPDNVGSIVYLMNNNEIAYFPVGNYLLRVTDNCGTYDIPVTVRQQDVHVYKWQYTTKQACEGLGVTVTGEAYFQNDTIPLYYAILSPRQYYSVVPAGEEVILPLPGTYRIGVSGTSSSVQDFEDRNTFTVTYENKALGIDANQSIGWVCPRQPKDLGTIWAFGVNGVRSQYGSGYTFQLAEEGNGATGPYLATNATGIFTATAQGPFKLTANKTYDIRISDTCGASAIQPIKIIDFATAQVVSTDRSEYCIGETVKFNVLNLPTNAKHFYWRYPNGEEHVGELTIYNFRVKDTGTYRVAITSDMCQDSIIGTVHVGVTPYLEICYSAVTDTSVNPYKYSLLGNWRPVRSYTYYTARAEADPNQPTNIRTDGAYNDFEAFWTIKNGKWTTNKADNWVWNAESTIFNAKGFELENKDPLGRFNAGLYGYGNAIPTAVVQNSRYQEAAFEGFEDYYFDNNNCDTVCPVGRRFDFSSYKSRIDSTQRHTGRYSIRVAPGDTVGVISPVLSTAGETGLPTFNETTILCNNTTSSVLKSIRANSDVILPSFAPLSGKKIVFSAWVKEMQDCSCTSYESNQVSLAVTNNSNGTSTVLKIKPTGAIIDGWQRFEQVLDLPAGSTGFSVVLIATGSTTVYYDDIRVHPYNANMKSFVYDARNLRMMAELDENNYATFFEYDDDATLTRVKKETERVVKTIKETRSALIKE